MKGINMYELYNGDCLEVMKNIKKHSVDMVLCDLPYGTTPLHWDNIIDFERLWELYDYICKENSAIILFGNEPFSSLLRISNLKLYKYDWYWKKERLTNVFQVKRRPGKIIENIMVFYNKQPTYNIQKTNYLGKKRTNKVGKDARFSITQSNKSDIRPKEYKDNGTRFPLQLLEYNRENNRNLLHPTQKPVDLLRYLIRTYSNEGNVVLDNCMGSGSTGVASILENRNFIEIEKDCTYYNIAKKRIEQYV